MLSTRKQFFAILLILCIALSLLLTACNNGGDTPTGDSPTTKMSGTQTSSGTEMPDNTPSNTSSDTETTSPDTSKIPTHSKPSDPSTHIHLEELAAYIEDEDIPYLNSVSGMDVKDALKEIEIEYGQYISEYITSEMILIALMTNGPLPQFRKNNMSGISSIAFEQVNELLASKSEATIDITDPKQNITALWIAASIYLTEDTYEDKETFDNAGLVARALGRAYSDSNEVESPGQFLSMYLGLHEPMFIGDE